MHERIRQVRLDNGLNKSKFAKLIGISSANVSNIEKEHSCCPSAQTIKKICSIFHIDANWLFFGERKTQPEEEEGEISQTLYLTHQSPSARKKRIIEDMLVDLGVCVYIKGFLYLVDTIMAYEESKKSGGGIYKHTAEMHKTTATSVERAIRYTIQSTPTLQARSNNTNSAIIAYLSLVVDRILEDEGKNKHKASGTERATNYAPM